MSWRAPRGHEHLGDRASDDAFPDPQRSSCRDWQDGHGDARWFIDKLDCGTYGRWQVVTPSGCEWDDLINDVIGPEAAVAGSALEVALEALVAGSEECAVWYPAGDLAGVDVVDDEREFVSRIVSAVAGGNIEPCLRFVRRGA